MVCSLEPYEKTAGITRQNPNRRDAEDKTDGDFRCVYLGVEALGILGYSVELREAQHVLLAARPVKNPQRKWRQRCKYLQHRKYTHAAVETDHRREARILCLSRCSYQILGTKRNSIMFKKTGSLKASAVRRKVHTAVARTHTSARSPRRTCRRLWLAEKKAAIRRES